VREIRSAVERAGGLTRQLLAFSRKQVLQPKVVDMRTLVTETRRMLRRLIGENIAINVKLPAEPAPVRADFTQMQQVLVNLAVNARDAMPRGGRIDISVEVVKQKSGPAVRLRVADVGTGMSPETLNRIFEPFFTTKPPGKGTGLGLPTVYGIVQQSGGTIDVRSEPGQGTTFDVQLPLAGDPVGPKLQPATRQSRLRGRETILLVEDEDAVRQVTARMLRRGGYSVLEAAHPRDALAAALRNAGRIALVVSDVGLPDLTGPVLVERLRSICPDIKVLFTSGYADEISVAGSDGGSAFIEKPFTARALLRCVRSVIDNRAA
jgi:CheY-like chemotaxis protein